MKRYNLIFMLALLTGIAISGCNPLKKMKDNSRDVRYNVNPPVLELVGDQVAINISGSYPPRYFNQNVIVTLTPTLRAGTSELELPETKVQGESVRDNHRVISWDNGGSFSYSESIPYRPDFQLSELVLNIVGTHKGNALHFDPVKIADGINVTALLVEKNGKSIYAPDQFVRTTPDRFEADIRYLMQQSDVRVAETRRPEIQALNDAVRAAAANERMSFTGTVLSAYASPEGPFDLNERLSTSRGRTSLDFWNRNFRTADVQQVMGSELLEVVTTPEDWDGFRQLMERSNIRDRDLILRVLSMHSDPIVREREIKNVAAAYEEIKVQILPELRRAKLTVNVKLEGWSDQELNAHFDRDPSVLKVEEILYTATLTQDANRKLAIYQAAARQFPNDYRTKNNLGVALLNLGRTAEAKTALTEARAVSDNEIVKNNMAVVLLREGNYAAAEELLNSAGSRDEVKYNLGTIKIIEGNYPDAINHFGNQVEVNAALAKLLSKDNNAALSTLNAIRSEAALVFYLRAVTGARLNNTDMVIQNLRQAATRSPELKANAVKDVEFANYFQDPQFRAIVQ